MIPLVQREFLASIDTLPALSMTYCRIAAMGRDGPPRGRVGRRNGLSTACVAPRSAFEISPNGHFLLIVPGLSIVVWCTGLLTAHIIG